MKNEKKTQEPRLLSPSELAACIKLMRECRHWTQEQLAEISRLNIRTIQRVEQKGTASLDTKRALARAFDADDIDAFNKPFVIPTEDEAKASQERFDREHATLPAIPLIYGRQLACLAETCMLNFSEAGFELSREANENFAELIDFFRDYGDCHDAYSEVQKLDVFASMQAYIDELKTLGVSLRYAERNVHIAFGVDPNSKPVLAKVVYIIGFPLGKEPEQLITPKSASIRL